MKTEPKNTPRVLSNSKRVESLASQCECLLSRHQIATLLSISVRSFGMLVAKGDYPKPDTRLGPQQPRWRSLTHNEWVRKRCGAS